MSEIVRCGVSDPEWKAIPELAGRHCILPAGHDGFHIAQRDDETLSATLERGYDIHAEAERTTGSRDTAKARNYWSLYGMSDARAAEVLKNARSIDKMLRAGDE